MGAINLGHSNLLMVPGAMLGAAFPRRKNALPRSLGLYHQLGIITVTLYHLG